MSTRDWSGRTLPRDLKRDCIRAESLAKNKVGGWASVMDISTRQFENAVIVDVNGDITLYNTPEVRKTLLFLFKEQHAKRVIVNLKNVKYIDSAGIASLVEGLKASRDLNSGFALYGLSQMTRQVLELTRLLKLFEVHNTEEEALGGGAAAL